MASACTAAASKGPGAVSDVATALGHVVITPATANGRVSRGRCVPVEHKAARRPRTRRPTVNASGGHGVSL